MIADRTKLITRVIAIVAVLLLVSRGAGDTIQAPVIAGFDRFVRAGDIEPGLGGRLLLSELNCTACHATTASGLQPKRGPNLDGVGNRLQRDWLIRFLVDPHKVKPGTTMPGLLHGLPQEKRQRAALALAAFLATQRSPFPSLKSDAKNPVAHEFWLKGDPHRGKQLYHQVGCVACHEPDPGYKAPPREQSALEKLIAQLSPEEIKELNLPRPPRPARSVPLGELASKYTHQSLTFFLLDPESVRRAGRMPNFQLRPDQAADLAAYLLAEEHTSRHPIQPTQEASLLTEGQRLFETLRCTSCHSLKGMKAGPAARPLARLDPEGKGTCLDTPPPGLPLFTLDRHQRTAIQQALTGLAGPREKVALPARQQLRLSLLRFNCYACHRREHLGGVPPRRRPYFETVGQVDLGDEGRLPPALDGVGAKLKQAWLKQVLNGSGAVRPHLMARMPKFPAESAHIAQLFARVDGSVQPTEKEVFGDTARLASAGRVLVNQAGCVLCHPVRDERLPGVVGVDLARLDRRLQPKWFRDFVKDPASLKPGTRMPAAFMGEKSSFPEVLEGKVDRQIAAMWVYLKDIEHQPLPEKIVEAKSQNFELVPTNKPIVLRTFMKEAGPVAIAIGFPQKVHVAFDAEEVRLVEAWRGRFLDAHGTWFNRLAPPASPLGKEVMAMPPGVPLAQLSDRKQPWPMAGGSRAGYQFRGYRLDSQGVPTLLYRFGPFAIEDRLQPSADKMLQRRLRLILGEKKEGQQQRVWFRANVGKRLQRETVYSCKNEDGLKTTLSKKIGSTGEVRTLGTRSEWIIPLDIKNEAVVEVTYAW